MNATASTAPIALDGTRPFRPRPLRLRLRAGQARRLVSLLVILAAWQAASSYGLLSPRSLPAPGTILLRALQLCQSGILPGNLAVSLQRVGIGLGIGVLTGGALALAAGLSRLGEDIVDAPMQMLRTMPHLALVPLLILWFGLGETPKLVLVSMGAAFPFYLNLFAGIRGIDPRLIEMGTTLRLSRAEMIRHIILPGALPSALVGLRYGIGVAWLSLVVGEQINAHSGIGYMMMDARDFLRTDVIIVGLIVYALLGLLTDAGVRALESRLLAWRPRFPRAA